MKHLLLTTIAAVLLVGCGQSQPPEPPDISIRKAVGAGNIEAAKQAIAAGADVNAKDKYGWTPLHSAAFNGHKEIVELLIDNGADLDAKNILGVTPLHYAANQGHTEIVELLIAKGADVNAIAGQHMDHATPLDWAIKYKRNETADLLRKHGGKTGEEL